MPPCWCACQERKSQGSSWRGEPNRILFHHPKHNRRAAPSLLSACTRLGSVFYGIRPVERLYVSLKRPHGVLLCDLNHSGTATQSHKRAPCAMSSSVSRRSGAGDNWGVVKNRGRFVTTGSGCVETGRYVPRCCCEVNNSWPLHHLPACFR
jgi:hypothetical protein